MSREKRSSGSSVAVAAVLMICCVQAAPVDGTDSFPTGQFIENVPCLSDSSQTYSLYLPSSYSSTSTSSSTRKWPVLLVFDPRGRSLFAAERFRQAAEVHGWILVSSDGTRSDGPWEPNRLALEALWPEVHGRYAVDPDRIYGAGFSGGALVAWYLAQFGTPSLAGIITCGGRLAPEIPLDSIPFAHFAAAGTEDFNFIEMKSLYRMVSRRGAPHQFRSFPGRHQWLPPELASESIEWMEILAMQRRLREVDAQLVERSFAKQVAAAVALEAAGENLEALHRYRMIAATWEGLRNVADVHRRVESLQEHPETRTQEEAERRAERLEVSHVSRLSKLLGDDRPLTSVTFEELRRELQIPTLQAQGRQETADAASARRVLEWIFTRTSFYMTRDRLRDGRPDEARLLLQIALDIHPEAGWVWYDLARAEARSGAKPEALAALHRAIDHGFVDLSRLQADPDLHSLRPSAEYDSVVSRLRKVAAHPE